MLQRSTGLLVSRCGVLLCAGLLGLLSAGSALAGTLRLEVCQSFSRDQGPFVGTAAPPLTAVASCGGGGQGLGLQTPQTQSFHSPYNASASWETTAPAGISIKTAYRINDDSYGIGDGQGWWGEFFWDGGRSGQIDDNFAASGCCHESFSSQHFGWFFACANSGGCSNPAQMTVGEVYLTAEEDTGPQLTPNGQLWSQGGWVRGTLPIGFSSADPSGVCSSALSLVNQSVNGPSATPNQDSWHQCPNAQFSTQINTAASEGSAGVGEGTMALTLSATNAAGVTSTATKTVEADNVSPSVVLSGPTDASSAAGTQYITATGSAGPSGVAGLSCSIDGGKPQWYPGAGAQLPVSGVGMHTATCTAQNNAHDASGNPAISAPASWTLRIRQPTAFAIAFHRVVDALLCRTVRRRVKRRVGKGGRSRYVTVRVSRCRARTALRRITTTAYVSRHGHRVAVHRTRLVRVVLLPHVINLTSRRIAFGKPTTLSGWLGTTDGTALGGQAVEIWGAPANGEGQFRPLALVQTKADGSWSAKIPAGPSRLIEAGYLGGSLTEPAVSSSVRTIVPAVVRLHISPTRIPWGGTVRISGRVLGGYIPGSHQQLLRLRIGAEGFFSTVGIPDISPDGRFHTTFTFYPGTGVVHYWFSVSTLSEADYPYAPGDSKRVSVVVGPRSR